MMWALPTLFLLPVAYAQVFTFVPPAKSPTSSSPIYVGKSNFTLPKSKIIEGRSFDRFIEIFYENTDFATAFANPTFQKLIKQGILLNQSFGVTHPSEPNYVAVTGGDYFGMADDNMHTIPSNISTVVDLLEQKHVPWATYQENMPTDGFIGFNFTQANYLNASDPPHTFYVRKHNGLIIYDSVATVPERAKRVRNFNDFAADINADALPQWMFITPNMVNDAHDTNVTFLAAWLEFWLVPLLQDPRFNNDRTLIVLTSDENETDNQNNRILTLLLGGAVPKQLQGTVDQTFYTHYSSLSTVQANWGLDSLGRQDTNKTVSNVFEFVAEKTGYKNLQFTPDQIPLLNMSGANPGPFNPNPSLVTPFLPPNATAVGAGGGPVFGTCSSKHGKHGHHGKNMEGDHC